MTNYLTIVSRFGKPSRTWLRSVRFIQVSIRGEKSITLCKQETLFLILGGGFFLSPFLFSYFFRWSVAYLCAMVMSMLDKFLEWHLNCCIASSNSKSNICRTARSNCALEFTRVHALQALSDSKPHAIACLVTRYEQCYIFKANVKPG